MLAPKDRAGIARRIAALVSLLLLVPVVRKLREQRQSKRHRRFPVFGH